MAKIDVKSELHEAITEMASLLDQKERLEVQIAKQRRRVAAWQALSAEEGEDEASAFPGGAAQTVVDNIFKEEGLSDACRTVLRGSRKDWMTITEVQAGLKELGFPLEKYKAPYASITTTVNRMAEGNNS